MILQHPEAAKTRDRCATFLAKNGHDYVNIATNETYKINSRI
jgi:hypothetical protein